MTHRKTALLLSLLLSAFSLQARTKLQGIVERGGQSIVTNGVSSATKSVRTFPGSTITICTSGVSSACNGGAGNLATLYSNSTGTPLSNPFHADSAAAWSAYLDDGTYDILFSPSSFAAWTLSAISIGSNGAIITAPPPSGGDDYATIQALINAYNPLDVEVGLGAGVYLSSTELTPPANHRLLLRGRGQLYTSNTDGTVIKATGTVQSILNINYQFSEIRDLKLDANRLATYGVYFAGGTNSIFDNVEVTGALLDGFHSDAVHLNQSIRLERCFSVTNGSLYATAGILAQYTPSSVRQSAIAGTASTISGNAVVTFAAGTPNLTTLGIRFGDILRVGSTSLTAFYGQIASVTANTITLNPRADNLPTSTAAGQDYAIGIGWGWFEENSNANGFNRLIGSWFRSNGAGNIMMGGLYGDKVRDGYADFSYGVGISMGYAYNIGTLYQPIVDGVYQEGGIGPDYLFGNITDGVVIAPGGGGHIFSTGGGAGQITIVRGGQAYSQQFGPYQNFLIDFNNNGGTKRHRITSDSINAFDSSLVDRLNGATAAWTNTPTVSNVTPFLGAVGAVSGDTTILLLDTLAAQGNTTASAVVEYDDSGLTGLRATLFIVSSNVNGVTIQRPALRLYDSTGTAVNWMAAIPAGKSVRVRISGLVK